VIEEIKRLEMARSRAPRRSKKQRPRFTKRARAKMRRRVKQKCGYTRRDVDRIAQESGAGIDPPDAYIEALVEVGF
jgi:hypothetical protein